MKRLLLRQVETRSETAEEPGNAGSAGSEAPWVAAGSRGSVPSRRADRDDVASVATLLVLEGCPRHRARSIAEAKIMEREFAESRDPQREAMSVEDAERIGLCSEPGVLERLAAAVDVPLLKRIVRRNLSAAEFAVLACDWAGYRSGVIAAEMRRSENAVYLLRSSARGKLDAAMKRLPEFEDMARWRRGSRTVRATEGEKVAGMWLNRCRHCGATNPTAVPKPPAACDVCGSPLAGQTAKERQHWSGETRGGPSCGA